VRRTWLVAGILGLTLVSPALADDPPLVQLEPVTKWTLNYDEEQCALLRDFGPEDNRLRLQIESYGSSTDFRFLLAGRPVPRSRAPSGRVRYAFPTDTVERGETASLEGTSDADGVSAVSFSGGFRPYEPDPHYERLSLKQKFEQGARPVAQVPEFERTIDRITITVAARARLQLRTGNMEKPLQAMRACIEDMQHRWGLDPALQARLTRNPVPYPSAVRNLQTNYPPSMVMRGRSAFVPVRIMVDALGQPTDCVVQVPNIESAFSQAVCDGLTGRFDPALDEAGNPVAGIYRTSVIYQMR